MLVNDGSPDDSLLRALSLQRADPRIVVVDLSRNFGHHKALMTAIAQARGDFVFVIDSDLEEAPELLIPFFERLAQGDGDVVYGVQERRRGGPIERLGGAIYYGAVKRLTSVPIPRDILTARLMTRRYVDSLLTFQESEFVISALWALAGYTQIPYLTHKEERHRGSTYNVVRKFKMLVDHLTSFSSGPLYAIFVFGMVVSALSLVALLYVVVNFLTAETVMPGWTSILISVWLVGGLTFFLLGVIALYVSHIFKEVKDRPRVLIRGVFRRDGKTRSGQAGIGNPTNEVPKFREDARA